MYFLLYVIISCLFFVNIEGKLVTSCENEKMEIICEDNNIIQVNRANYGRTSQYTCNSNNEVQSDISCYADAALRILKIKCDDTQGCTIKASNDVFGDPCYGTYKYLEAEYECVPDADFQYDRTCEYSKLNIKCKDNKTIRIVEANFGRLTQSICNYPPIKTTDCVNKQSTRIVADLCNNLKSCTIRAEVDLLGDACSGTVKYLTVKYKCINS